MSINKSEKQELLEKLNLLLKKQSQFQQEIKNLELQITRLHTTEPKNASTHVEEQLEIKTEIVEAPKEKQIHKVLKESDNQPGKVKEKKKSAFSYELEKFIGENLINKIGIAVLIIGVGIGVKYVIDNDLISPLVRIILGYVVGIGLAAFAVRTKAKYLNFSAVLFSGSMAIHYFITYAAYNYYQLFPDIVAIVLMVIITILTVALAQYYNEQVIAHFGLVGAYIIPYLLKESFLDVTTLFIYMAIINVGILFLSTKKRWKPLIYLAFIATWTIFITWFASSNYENQLTISLSFISIFFTIFYLVFLSYKLLLKEKLKIDDIIFLLLNSSLLYILGYIAIIYNGDNKDFLGLFSIINAIIHGVTAYLIYKSKLENKNLFYWTIGLTVALFTITIPVQFNVGITAIIWAIETAFIFLYGKSKKIQVFEIISYVLIFLTTLITVSNWSTTSYNLYSRSVEQIFTPILNIGFLSSLVVIICFGFIYYINKKTNLVKTDIKTKTTGFEVLFSIAFLIILYFTFFIDISLYWNNVQIYTSFELSSDGIWEKQYDKLNLDIWKFKGIWLINYSLLFASLLSFANFKWLKNKNFDGFNFVINSFVLVIFLSSGLLQLSQLRESYLNTELAANYDVSIFHLLIRYVAYSFFSLLLYSTYRFVIRRFQVNIFQKIFEVFLSISVIWILSAELINWLDIYGSTNLYKHWLSILWGVFSFMLIAYGIWKKKKHIRITAMALLGVTLIKLFFYDLTNLETIPKTIVFLCIGVILLVVSFLYNKYKPTLLEENT